MQNRMSDAETAANPGMLSPAAVAQNRCDRSCLEDFANQYLEALITDNPTAASLAPTVKYSENQKLVAIGEGLWTKAKKIGDYRIYAADTRREQIAFLGNIETADGWSMLAVRLRIQNNQVTEVETIIPGASASEGSFDLSGGAADLNKARPAFASPLLHEERRDRSQIVMAADLHYEGIERGNGDIVPFGSNCIKIENGVQLTLNPDFPSPVSSPSGAKLPNFQGMGCQDQFNTHLWDTDTITDRRYPVVDEERGIVVAFAMYNQYAKAPCAEVVDYGAVCPKKATRPYTLAIAEAFRIQSGFIEDVEAVFAVLPELKLRGLW